MSIFEAAHGWDREAGGRGSKKALPPQNLSHISYNDETWHSDTLPKKNTKKYINHVTQSFRSAEISIFFTENQHFLLYQEIQA